MAKQKQAQMATSDFNLQKVSTKDLSKHVKGTIKIGGNLMCFGQRGTGKTEIMKSAIAASGCQEAYVNLSVMERVDLGGYPDLMSSKQDRKFVEYLLPAFFAPLFDAEKPVVLLLDELDKADPSLWAPLLELTQFRSINGRPLTNLKAVLTTGNLISEGGSRPSLPLLDRAEKFLVEPDATSWLNWAGEVGGIHPSITSYIQDHPNDLFGNVDPEERYADASPRSWTRASNILFQGEAHGWNSELLNAKVSACVGKEIGIKYAHYYEHYQQLLPLVDAIFKGDTVDDKFKKLEPTKKLVCTMIACARLATQLDNLKQGAKKPQSLGYVGKFLQKVSYETALVAIRSQIHQKRMMDHDFAELEDWKPLISSLSKAMGVEV